MGKNRGFKPQGMVNPMLMSKRTMPSGPTIQERLNRSSRPTWEDIKKLANKKQKSSSEFLETWENTHFQEELTKFRDHKRSDQEKSQLRLLKKEAKSKKEKRRSLSSERGREKRRSSSMDACRETRREKRRSSSSESGRERLKRPSKRRTKNDDVEKKLHPHKLSQLLKTNSWKDD